MSDYIINEPYVERLNAEIFSSLNQLRSVLSDLFETSSRLTEALGSDAETMQQSFYEIAGKLNESEDEAVKIHDALTEYLEKVEAIHKTLS